MHLVSFTCSYTQWRLKYIEDEKNTSRKSAKRHNIISTRLLQQQKIQKNHHHWHQTKIKNNNKSKSHSPFFTISSCLTQEESWTPFGNWTDVAYWQFTNKTKQKMYAFVRGLCKRIVMLCFHFAQNSSLFL